ncbi:MAG: transglycosylase SLT domain-containing protein [Pseudomonadota bacterium]|nr:transglycosylase SLT domain-containing protein [Pseudomonadota bacterium]
MHPTPLSLSKFTCRFALCLLSLVPALAQADRPAFEQVLSSSDPSLLIQWGMRYQHGVRAPQSIDHAIQLYCKAASMGNSEAHYRLGWIYARRLAKEKDEVLAAAWLLKAAKKAYQPARSMLAKWDVEASRIPLNPDCVLSDRMISRTIKKKEKAEQPKMAPGKKPGRGRIETLKKPGRGRIETLVRQLAPRYGLAPELVLAIVEVESNFNPRAQSPKNAQGLMQLIPETAARFGVTDPWDPQQNLHGGMAYLRWLLDRFSGDLVLALAGYNAGENAVERHGGVPPYPETKSYVRRVAKSMGLSEDELKALGTRVAKQGLRKREGIAPGQGQAVRRDSPG